ncbi:helix-turn-helix transcriptional regulator [Xenorhabdus khoisanae]|uniref:helix-turn-helix domain-containing protein n=1 Tax=Xenorhabdus khoisanae TaxID=880157 RepID=UPI0023584289|nr:helix-turn-helix transcriptional regulator [Xenorhabdus khoisanae]MDC9615504.1 helix-turn-helix transcriptional regulator [Xenorhabdus khoisanae]
MNINRKISSSIGKRIHMRRRILGLTMKNLAEKSGTFQPQILRYETGERKISAAQLFLIATALDTPIDWFFMDCSPNLEDKDPKNRGKDESS